jgi:hypothetical protein
VPRVKVSSTLLAVPDSVSVIASELSEENPTWPVTVKVAPGVATVGQFNTRGLPGVESVKLNVAVPVTPQVMEALAPVIVAWPLRVARLNVAPTDGSRGP